MRRERRVSSRMLLLVSVAIMIGTGMSCKIGNITLGSSTTDRWSVTSLEIDEFPVPEGQIREWTFSLPRTNAALLSLEARIDARRPAGSLPILGITLNDTPIPGKALINKPDTYTVAGRGGYPYYQVDSRRQSGTWAVFLSPDYDTHNLPGPRYAVDEGDAYSYIFDVSKIVRRDTVNVLRIINHHDVSSPRRGDPMHLVIRHMKVMANLR